jgi:glycosyltransferase involved in cell wall biosynthesis
VGSPVLPLHDASVASVGAAETAHRPSEPALSIIVPCFNEEGNLRELVRRTREILGIYHLPAEIILVDDKSRDGTRALIEELSREHSQVRGLFHDRNQGIVGGWRTGLAVARALILKREGPDVVQGWRIAHNFSGTYRYLLSVAFSFLLNRLFGTRLRDIKSGFLCTRKEVFAEMLASRYRYRCFQHFVVVNAVTKGLTVRQEPILFWKRHAGESFISSPFAFALKSVVDLPRAFWEFRVLNRRERRAAAAAARA